MNCTEILSSINWPTNIMVLDFETYFNQEYNLKKMSTVEYVTSEKFDFLGCGVGNGGDIKFIPKPQLKEFLTFLQRNENYGKHFQKVTVIIQRAKFDALILKEKLGIMPPFIIDIIDLAKHYDARMKHSLDSLAKMFKLQPKGNMQQFKGLHYEDMDEIQKLNLQEYTENDIDLEYKIFVELLPLLSNPEIELPIARHTLDMYLYARMAFDFEHATDLKDKMIQQMNHSIGLTGLPKDVISGNKSFVNELQKLLPEGEEIPQKQGTNGLIPALAKNDLGMQQLLQHKKPLVKDLVAARLAVRSWPLHIKRIDNMERQARCKNGYLGMPIGYYSAHTGRYGGGEGINPQNFGGRGRGTENHPLIQAMRKLLIAPPNSKFYIADFAQIEARVLAWIAGQWDLVEGFANGEDIYSVFASHLFNADVHKPKKDDSPEIAKLCKVRRGFGKDAILGCGYGMGTNKFYDNCKKNPGLKPLVESGEYDWEFVNKLIKTYRKKYTSITKFWRTVEKCFKLVTKYPNEIRRYSINDKLKLEGDLLTFWNYGGTVHLQLPSGRILYYRHCKIAKDYGYETLHWRWGHLWGGSITENIVQAIARDIMVEAILRLESIGYPIILHVHDSIVTPILKKETTEFTQNCIIKTMCENPTWAKELPIAAEGEYSHVFK